MKQALRLRVLSDGDRAALLRLIDDIPTIMGECTPDCMGDPVMATLSIQLIQSLCEGVPPTVEDLASRCALPPDLVLARLERLAAKGLVRLSPRLSRSNTRPVMPTALLRSYGDDALDRLYYAFTQALNRL